MLRWVLVAAAAFAGAPLVAHWHHGPEKPVIVSGHADPRRTASGAEERWRKKSVEVVLDGSLDAKNVDLRESVVNAFGAWLEGVPDLPRVSFDHEPARPIAIGPDGENRIYYGLIPIAGHTDDLALTIAYPDPESGEILETDIVINSRTKIMTSGVAPGSGTRTSSGAKSSRFDDSSSTGSCNGGYDLPSVVTHEVGHFFGLSEDITNQSATMYYSTAPCETRQRKVTMSDALEMTKLYSLPAAAESSAAPSSASPSVQCGVTARAPNGESARRALFCASSLLFAVRFRRSSSRRPRR